MVMSALVSRNMCVTANSELDWIVPFRLRPDIAAGSILEWRVILVIANTSSPCRRENRLFRTCKLCPAAAGIHPTVTS